MPQHKSAKKRLRQDAQRRERNQAKRSHLRTMMKKVRSADEPEQARQLLNDVKSLLDRLVGKNILHKNKAANYKSDLERYVNQLDA